MARGCVVWLFLGVVIFAGVVESVLYLEELDTEYLPYRYNSEAYGYAQEALEQGTADPRAEMYYFYGIGSNNIHVIDYSDPSDLERVHYEVIDNRAGVISDIQTCGTMLAVTFSSTDPANILKGYVYTYDLYDPNQPSMTRRQEIEVTGSRPETLAFNADCSRMVVAVEGEIRTSDGEVVDPEGSIAVITNFQTGSTPVVDQYDFQQFNALASTYTSRGVRWIHRGEAISGTTMFSQDLEPETIVLDSTGNVAYFNFQENNAMGRIDLSTPSPTMELYALPVTNWTSNRKLDPSDRDGGPNLGNWDIYGFLQPDAILYYQKNNKDYIITADEGNAKGFGSWSEVKRGKAFFDDDEIASSVSSVLKAALGDDTKLGRKEFTKVEGKNANGKYEKFYSFGGRSISIFEVKNDGQSGNSYSLHWVYNSGDDLEQNINSRYPAIFNGDSKENDGAQLPYNQRDRYSDDEGVSPESLIMGTVDGRDYVFVGNERPGVIAIFDIDDPENPSFESVNYLAAYEESKTKTYLELYNDRQASCLDPESLTFIPADRSPTGNPLLAAISEPSTAVTFMEVKKGTQPGAPVVKDGDGNGGGTNGAAVNTLSILLVLLSAILYHL